MSRREADTSQLGFEGLLHEAESENRARAFARATEHLPGTMEEALPFYRALLDKHHAAMLAADVEETMRLRREAHALAKKLNGGEPGILADDDAPGRVLERETMTAPGTVPLWGQTGEFILTLGAMRVRIELEGVFGIGSHFGYWPGFAAHAVDLDKPFLSETGYRSFLGVHAEPMAGLAPDALVTKVLEYHLAHALKGRLVAIEPRFCERLTCR